MRKFGEAYIAFLSIVFVGLMLLLVFALAGWLGTLIYEVGTR